MFDCLLTAPFCMEVCFRRTSEASALSARHRAHRIAIAIASQSHRKHLSFYQNYSHLMSLRIALILRDETQCRAILIIQTFIY